MPSALQAIRSTGSRRTAATVLAVRTNCPIRSPPRIGTASMPVSGWMRSRTARWSARRAHGSTKMPPTLSWMWRDWTAATPARMVTCAERSRKELPAVPSTPFIRSATDCLSVVLLRWSVKDCRASRTAGRIYPVLRTVPVIKPSATAWRYPAWSLSCRGSLPRFYEAQR